MYRHCTVCLGKNTLILALVSMSIVFVFGRPYTYELWLLVPQYQQPRLFGPAGVKAI